MKGKITYRLWTVRGYVMVNVRYNLEMILGGQIGKGSITTEGEGDKPPELDDEDVQAEIVQACVEDFMSRKEEPEEEKKETYKRVLPDSLWGAN